MTDERFDQLLNEIRDEPLLDGKMSSEEMAAVRDRVYQRLTAPACAEFRPEFGDYLSGKLTEARRLLVEDHLARCADCRREVAEGKPKVTVMPVRKPVASRKWVRWAVAAGLVFGGLFVSRDRIDAALAPSGPRATVVALTGEAYRLSLQLPQEAVHQGATLTDGELIRTGAGSRAVLQLADGSQVEMNERTEIAITAAWSGNTVRLARGDVMVQAAQQGRKRLKVASRDSVASVKGTTFGVSSGAAGSMVSVVEGSVAVSQPGSERLLSQGQHAATNAALETVQVRDAIAWSRDRERYFALLSAVSGIEKQLVEASLANTRTSPRLLRYLPDGVQFYVAIPNVGGALRQSLFQLEQRSRENAALGEWWASGQATDLRQTLDRIQSVTPLLGEEVVFVLVHDASRPGHVNPLVLAEVQSGRQKELQQALDRIAGDSTGDSNSKGSAPYRVTPELMLISEDSATVAAMTGRIGRGAASPFAADIAKRYQRGVGWLFGVDVTAMPDDVRKSSHGKLLGLASMQRLFFEQGVGGRADENQAALSFSGIRTGLASWLAPAGSAGSTEYISPEAVAVFSASTRDPRQVFDEIVSMLRSENGFAEGLRRFESETGVSVGADIAGSFGTDFTLAIERPSLPVPGWVAAFEVVRPGVLDDTIRRLADSMNRGLRPEQADGRLTFKQESVSGRTWMSLTNSSGIAFHWTYDRGYMIASTDRASAAHAIAVRESGASLVHSANFQQRFPAGGTVHHSGFIWVNPGTTLAELAGLVDNPLLKNLLTGQEPVLIVLDAAMEQIQASSRTRLTSVIVDMLLTQGVPGPGNGPVQVEKHLKRLNQ